MFVVFMTRLLAKYVEAQYDLRYSFVCYSLVIGAVFHQGFTSLVQDSFLFNDFFILKRTVLLSSFKK